jgi:anti-sigma-K factor RskA
MSSEDTHEDAPNNESLAAEYVLGTLEADERAQAQALIESDPEFAALVQYWERRLGELHAMVDAIEPPAETWERLTARLEGLAPSGEILLPHVEAPPSLDAEPLDPQQLDAADGDIVLLNRQLRHWRVSTMMTGALAAGLAAVIVAAAITPDILPARFRPPPRVVQVVKTEPAKPVLPSRFVAVLQQDAASPAFILTVDIEGRSLTVRRVAADVQAGKSYELWLVSDRFPAPRSLGVVGSSEFTIDNKLAGYDPGTITEATYAVTLEPEGGSPTGVATGPILWTGKLVQALPGARPPAPRSP